MRILFTLPRPLFPADTGGKIRTLNIFRRLAKRVEIHAVSLAHPEQDADAIAGMQKEFHSYTAVPWQETRKFTPAFYAEFVRSRFGELPYFLAKYDLPQFARAVEDLAARKHFDLLLCDFLQSAVAFGGSAMRPRVIFQHNVEYVIRQRHWEMEKNPLRKWLLDGEWKKARAAEAAVCRQFDHVITVSEEDERQIRNEFGAKHVTALPTGVDADYFRPQAAEPKRGNIVFVGSMDWHPNEDGIFWFVREIYPLLRQSTAHANLTVVGRNPSPRIRELAAADSSIEITGTVPDVRPYLARAEVVIVPLRIGGGTRIKIFEAMAMGRAVVSTTLGAEGLPVAQGREILLEDEPRQFAGALTKLLGQPAAREALARNAREKVVRDHTWERVAECMEEILRGVAGAAQQGRDLGAVATTGAMLAN